MLKITQLLKESFTTYKSNFSKIFWIALPILILTIISEYYIAVSTTIIDNRDFGNMSYLFVSMIIYIVTILAVSLYFGPVLNRAIQKKEDDGSFDSKLAYNFQKKNIFKWIMVNIWGFLYMVLAMLPYIVVSALLTVILFMNRDSYIAALILSSLIGLTMLIGIILNINKFVLYKNIYFSKDDISARDAVRESIEIGKTKSKQVWMLIFSLIILTFIMIIMYFGLGFMSGLLTGNISNNVLYYSETILYGVLSAVFFLPLMSIVAAKGYVKIRG